MTDETDHSPESTTMRYGRAGIQRYEVGTRGRPARSPREAAIRTLRLKAFGRVMREMREAAGLNVAEAAEIARLSSPRKLSQYEGSCYPPGEAQIRLASTYGCTSYDMATTVLRHSDPDMYLAIVGQPGFMPEEDEIEAMIAEMKRNAKKDK
ncbi:helix-turn-helix domain-containing protein [Palleronia sp.]|uniref:helix-turn-helix domain-containing protein n=1 Tax=Palleronia sp. TaxID=1940284 RepID=UPI0035C79F2C